MGPKCYPTLFTIKSAANDVRCTCDSLIELKKNYDLQGIIHIWFIFFSC